MGKLFETGWQRKPRDAEGKLIPDPSDNTKIDTKEQPAQAKGKDGMETVMVTKTIDSKGKGSETSDLAKMQTATDKPEPAAAQVVLEGTRLPAV